MACGSSNQPTVEFFLSSLWSWLPEGRKRILEALESCDVVRAPSTTRLDISQLQPSRGYERCSCPINTVQEQARFTWDEKYDWFHVQCMDGDKDYIMNEYLKAQSEMENELVEKDMLWDGGSLIPTVENDLIDTSRHRVATLDESDDSVVAASPERVRTQRSNGRGRVEKRMERRTVKEDAAYPF